MIFMVFDSDQGKNVAQTDKSNTICELTTHSKAYSEHSKCDKNRTVVN